MSNLTKVFPEFNWMFDTWLGSGDYSLDKGSSFCEETSDEKNFYMKFTAPGHDASSVKASLSGNFLTISGEHSSETKNSKFAKSFEYSWTVSKHVDYDKIEIKCVNGVVTITMPKLAQPKSTVRSLPVT